MCYSSEGKSAGPSNIDGKEAHTSENLFVQYMTYVFDQTHIKCIEVPIYENNVRLVYAYQPLTVSIYTSEVENCQWH